MALYSLIHIPLAEQPGLLGRIAAWLRPGACCSAPPGAGRGPAPTRTGSVAARRCGGATRTPPPAGAGWWTPGWSSSARSTFRRATGGTRSSGARRPPG
ncbi:hypothetical protein OG500_04615 [Kitasatospora sp. NBC_01250]